MPTETLKIIGLSHHRRGRWGACFYDRIHHSIYTSAPTINIYYDFYDYTKNNLSKIRVIRKAIERYCQIFINVFGNGSFLSKNISDVSDKISHFVRSDDQMDCHTISKSWMNVKKFFFVSIIILWDTMPACKLSMLWSLPFGKGDLEGFFKGGTTSPCTPSWGGH